MGRALAEDDREPAERARKYFAAKADAVAASGTLLERGEALGDLAFSLSGVKAYSESIATGQRALRMVLEIEATLETELGWVADSLFGIGASLCGGGDAGSGISLVSAARRTDPDEGAGAGP